jgi:uncharacterized membrane protein YcaP (DUF421 family)
MDYSFDLQRIFIGDLPLLFIVEIILRTLILYGYALFLFRLLPRRNMGNMTQLEVLLIIALGSALGDPMFYPDVPLLHGVAVITVIAIVNQVLAWLARRGDRWERVIEGDPVQVIEHGQLDLGGMASASLTREDVFMELRLGNYEHLGQIEHAYIETNGAISFQPYDPDNARPGLPLVPLETLSGDDFYRAGDTVPETKLYGCYHCGKIQHHELENAFGHCPRCNREQWLVSVIYPPSE